MGHITDHFGKRRDVAPAGRGYSGDVDVSPAQWDGGPDGVLVLHGFTGSPHSVRPLAANFAEAGLAVEMPLLPGHGTTVHDMSTRTWRRRAWRSRRTRSRTWTCSPPASGFGATGTTRPGCRWWGSEELVLCGPACRERRVNSARCSVVRSAYLHSRQLRVDRRPGAVVLGTGLYGSGSSGARGAGSSTRWGRPCPRRNS